MPVLKNIRQERFCQEIARGKTLIAAYKAAGYKPSAPNATHLRDRPEIANRLQEITSDFSKRIGITKERVAQELARISFANVTDVLSFKKGRVTLIDSDKITPDAVAAIAEVRETKDGIALKMHDKRAALVDLGKHLGLFRADAADTGELTLAELVAASYEAGEKRGNAKQIEGTVIEAEKAGGDPGAT